MNRLIAKELSDFILFWRILGPVLLLLCLGMVLFSWPDRGFASFLLFLALLFGFYTFKHTQMAKRALKLIKHGEPENCLVQILKESGDSRDYYKGIATRSESGEKWDILFTPPMWNVDPLVQKQIHANAYFEPETGCPLVVLIDDEYLWAERVPERLSSSKKSA